MAGCLHHVHHHFIQDSKRSELFLQPMDYSVQLRLVTVRARLQANWWSCSVTSLHHQPHTSHGRMAVQSQFHIGKRCWFRTRPLNILLTFRISYRTTLPSVKRIYQSDCGTCLLIGGYMWKQGPSNHWYLTFFCDSSTIGLIHYRSDKKFRAPSVLSLCLLRSDFKIIFPLAKLDFYIWRTCL